LSERKRPILTTGKRKTAIARAVIEPGSGKVLVNNFPLEAISPEVARDKILEPILLAGERAKGVDISVRVSGGGFMGQAEACRMAIAKGLLEWWRSSELRRIFMAYDRTMLAGDPRRTEPKKFGGPGARRRRQKSYR
jgi:small subunit ribosomal protein S9